jgi:hypothetical protein
MIETPQACKDLIELTLSEKVDLFIDYVFGGRHHTTKVINHNSWYEVKFYQDVASWDFSIMTKMVVASHDLGLRSSIEANGLRGLKVLLHNRKSREGLMHQRHPTLEQHLERIGRVTQ